MSLVFEKSNEGRQNCILPGCDVDILALPDTIKRTTALRLPQISESEIARHYTSLAKKAHGVNDGFYPLGSCTMKYNPRINEEMAALKGFTAIHPLQPENTVQGCLEVLRTAEKYLCQVTGMDNMTFQPAAGAQGEFTGLLLIKAYHKSKGDHKRTEIIVPDSAHGTNPASAVMAGFQVVSIPSNPDGSVNIEKLKVAVSDKTAGLMLTNPSTIGLFERNILEITNIIHEAGGFVYYDGANLNAIMGIVRPGDMGFDVIHLNLHKTFSTPHGGGGPGSGPVGCKKILAPFLPTPYVSGEDDFKLDYDLPMSIGRMRSFYGNFLVVVRALTYLMTNGCDGLRHASENAVLNANYLMSKISDVYDVGFKGTCMHEFVVTLEKLKNEKNVSALDIAKGLIDKGVHPPTMYFPLIVSEALMFEPTETETLQTLDEVAEILKELYTTALEQPDVLRNAPVTTPVKRLDEVKAARYPKLKFDFE